MLSRKINDKKISDFLRNRSRNRSHFPQPFPKRFLCFLLLLSWKISIFADAFNKKEKEIWQNM